MDRMVVIILALSGGGLSSYLLGLLKMIILLCRMLSTDAATPEVTTWLLGCKALLTEVSGMQNVRVRNS